MKTKTAILVNPGKFEIHEKEIIINPNQVMAKVAACGLCNWELNHWKGIIGNCPQTLGHEWSGTIVEVGNAVSKFKLGDKITVLPTSLSGFSEYAVVEEEVCFKLDDSVNLQHALGEPLKCIITVLKATAPQVGDCGVIVGSGPMGVWCMQALAGKFLSNLIVVDINDERLELAKKNGATHVINSQKENAVDEISKITNGRMADFVIEGTGVPIVLNMSTKYLKTGRGKLVLMSSHETVCKEFDFRECLTRGMEIVMPFPSYSLNQLDDMRIAVEYINNGTFDLTDLVTHKFPLDQINLAFETLENKPNDYIKGIVIP